MLTLQDFIDNELDQGFDYWIGLNDKDDEDTFVWQGEGGLEWSSDVDGNSRSIDEYFT